MDEPPASQSKKIFVDEEIARIVKQHWGRLTAALIADLGHFELAQECLQDAVLSALIHWKKNGIATSPQAWLYQTARRKAIDRIRRDQNYGRKRDELQYLTELDQQMVEEENHEITDERLRLIFTCCHPALDKKSSVALTLRTLGGMTTQQIAAGFLDKPSAMAQRLVRAQNKIRKAAIPYEVPGPDLWPERLNRVLDVIYLIYNEGHFSLSSQHHTRAELCKEARILGEALLEMLPNEAEVLGLCALMQLHEARREARFDLDGAIIALENQDRNKWDSDLLAAGQEKLEQALTLRSTGPYQIQAAISALHGQAKFHEATDWAQITALYDALWQHTKSSVVLLNKYVAMSNFKAPDKVLILVEELSDTLCDYQPFHAARAHLLARAEKISQAMEAYDVAISLSNDVATIKFLNQKMDALKRDG